MAVRKREGKEGVRWLVDYYDSTGKRRYLTCRTWKEAKSREAELTRRKDRGEHIVVTKTTLGEIAAVSPQNRGYKATSRRQVESTLDQRILPRFGHIPVQKITRHAVSAFMLDIRRAGLGKHRTRSILSILRMLLQDAVEQGLVVTNPCDGVKIPTVEADHAPVDEDKKFTPMEEDQVAEYVETAQRLYPPPSPFGALLTLAAYTGMRRAEIFGLKWHDIVEDGTNPTIQVRRNWDPVAKIFTTPKTRAANREIPLFPVALRALKEWKMASDRTGPDDRIFYISYHSAWHAHTRTLKAANMRHCRLHDLRVVFASILAKRNLPPKIAQRLMGHANISMTLDLYARFSRDDEPILDECLRGFGRV